MMQPENIVPASGVVYAGFWRRFVANLLDGIILGIVSFPINFITSLISGTSNSNSPAAMLASSVGSLIVLAIQIAYFVYFIGSKGQTLGKMVMKIKVVKVGTNEAPGYVKAFLRDIVGKMLSALVLSLGYLWMLWDSKKQTWHDKIAGTVVVKVNTDVIKV